MGTLSLSELMEWPLCVVTHERASPNNFGTAAYHLSAVSHDMDYYATIYANDRCKIQAACHERLL